MAHSQFAFWLKVYNIDELGMGSGNEPQNAARNSNFVFQYLDWGTHNYHNIRFCLTISSVKQTAALCSLLI